MVLMLGVGVQITSGVANGLADKTAAGHRHRAARGDLDPDRLRRAVGVVQAVGVRRPEHQLRRRAPFGAGRRRRCAAAQWPAGGDAAAGTGGRLQAMSARRVRRRRRTPPTLGSSTRKPDCSSAVGGPVGSAAASALQAVYDSGPGPPPSAQTSPTRWASGTPATTPTSPMAAPARAGQRTAANGSGPGRRSRTTSRPTTQLPATRRSRRPLAAITALGMNGGRRTRRASRAVGVRARSRDPAPPPVVPRLQLPSRSCPSRRGSVSHVDDL